MSEQPDETSEMVRAGMRAAMTLSAQAAQRAIRAREQHHRERQAQSQQRAAELQARFDAERSAAVASLSPVGQDQWWAKASTNDIAGMYETAHAWEDLDPTARTAADKIRQEVDTRYGIDPGSLDRSADLDVDALSQREKARLDESAAVAISTDAAADRAEHEGADTDYAAASESRTDALWDSAERRTDTAASLEGVASAEAVNGRMLADTGQGRPAQAATVAPSQKPSQTTTKTAARRLGPQQQTRQPHRG